MPKGNKSYESTVMRMAGNIAAGFTPQMVHELPWDMDGSPETLAFTKAIAVISVDVARAIVAQVLLTEPTEDSKP